MRHDDQLVPANSHRATDTRTLAWLTRFLLVLSAVVMTTACAAINRVQTADADRDGTNDAAGFTFVNRSSPDEYCGLLGTRRPDIPSELDPADIGSALVGISAIADISVLAPEEIKAAWADLTWPLQLVVDASIDQDSGDGETWAAAQQGFDETSAQLAETIANLCPDTVWMPEPRTPGGHTAT